MDRIISNVNAFRLAGLFSWRIPRLAESDGRNCNVVDIVVRRREVVVWDGLSSYGEWKTYYY